MAALLKLPFRFQKLSSGSDYFNISRMVSTNLNVLTSDAKKSFMDSFDTVLADCDGVLWIGGGAINGAPDVMNTFKANGKKIYYVTNNSTSTRVDFVDKCKRLGFNADENDIISTAWLTGQYLKSKNFNKKVYLVGPKSVQKELADVGIDSFGVGPDTVEGSKNTLADIDVSRLKEGVGAVVVGYDVHFSLIKMIKACTYLNDPECAFIATNTDERFPNKKKLVWPGTGTFVAAVETAAQRKPLILGKPSTYIVDNILKSQGLDPKRTLMIGDRCNTDIYFGTRTGMQTLLVLTGVTSLLDLETFSQNNEHHLIPTYYTESIADLLPLLK